MEPREAARPDARTGATPEASAHTGRERDWDRWAGIAGIAFVLLGLADLITPARPDPTLPVGDFTARLAADLTGHQVSLWLGFLADAAFLVFLAGAWGRLRRFEGPGGLFAMVFLVAGLANVTVLLVSRALYLGLVQYGSSGEPDPAALIAVTVAGDWAGSAALPVVALAFLAAAGAVLTTGAFPRWLGWLAAATAVLTLLSLAWNIQTATEGVLGVVSTVGFWVSVATVLAAGVLLVLRPGTRPGASW